MNSFGVGQEDIDAYFKSLLDLNEHIKKTHFKILTYSIGRKMDEDEINEFMENNLYKKTEEEDEQNVTCFSKLKIKKFYQTILFYLDRIFEFVAKYIDETDQKKVKQRGKNMIDDYNQIFIDYKKSLNEAYREKDLLTKEKLN